MSNNFINHVAPPTSQVPKREQVGELERIGNRIRVVNSQLTSLSTGYSPEFGARVHAILHLSAPRDQAMLDAWSRIGHGDAQRSPRVDLIRANESSVSPMGAACLISYAKGYLDELEAIRAATSAVVGATPSQTSEPTSVILPQMPSSATRSQPSRSPSPGPSQEKSNHPSLATPEPDTARHPDSTKKTSSRQPQRAD